MTPNEWRAGGELFAWRGHQIFCRAAGDGDPLLLVHGFPTASWDWSMVWPALAKHYRVLALDLIGYGFSAKPRDFDYTVFAQADLVEAFLEREGVTRYRLLAHDFGDTVAQELLARHEATRIVSACLLNGGLFPEVHRATTIQKLLASPIGPLIARLSSYRTFAKSMRGIWGDHPVHESELRGMWQLVTEHQGMRVMPKLIGYMAERRANRARWVGAITGATIPIRFINGLEDPVSGAHAVARYRELVPDPNVVELARVGHYPQVEAPEAVTVAVLDHFGRR